jgi:hypothetical protein
MKVKKISAELSAEFEYICSFVEMKFWGDSFKDFGILGVEGILEIRALKFA